MEFLIGHSKKFLRTCKRRPRKVTVPTVKISMMNAFKVLPPVKKPNQVVPVDEEGKRVRWKDVEDGRKKKVELKRIIRNKEREGQRWIIEFYEYWD